MLFYANSLIIQKLFVNLQPKDARTGYASAIQVYLIALACTVLAPENKKITIMTAIELRAELFREMSPLLDNESAMTKMLAFVKSLVPAKKAKTESDWANRFAGAWKDSRSAEEIISDIRESRTANSREFEL